jgi:hypothetical protein
MNRIVVLALRAGTISIVKPQLMEVPSLRAGRLPHCALVLMRLRIKAN